MKKIFIAAHYNLNNGDRAVLEATIQLLYGKNYEIVVSAFEKEKLIDKRFRTVSWPISSKIKNRIYTLLIKLKKTNLLKLIYKLLVDKEYLDELQNSDIILISGGHHLTDILGEHTFYQLGLNYLIPIYESKDIFLLPQSIGPIKKENQHILETLVNILQNVKNIAYRDQSSKMFLKELNITTPTTFVPDIVYSINNRKLEKQEKTIGIALYCNYSKEKESLKKFVLDNLILLCQNLTDKGYKIRIIPMEVKNTKSDDRITANKIINKIKLVNNHADICIEEPKNNEILSIVELFSNKDFILAYKTHSVVFSLINLVPCVAIAYHPKSIEFMESVNLKEYAIEDRNATMEALNELINKIIVNEKNIIITEKAGIEKNREIISNYISTIVK